MKKGFLLFLPFPFLHKQYVYTGAGSCNTLEEHRGLLHFSVTVKVGYRTRIPPPSLGNDVA